MSNSDADSREEFEDQYQYCTQVEYASKAVDNSGTAVAIQCKDGVVMVSNVCFPNVSRMSMLRPSNRIMSPGRREDAAVEDALAWIQQKNSCLR